MGPPLAARKGRPFDQDTLFVAVAAVQSRIHTPVEYRRPPFVCLIANMVQ